MRRSTSRRPTARGKTVAISYFDQNRTELNPIKTLWETLCPDGGDYVFIGGDEKKPKHVCGYLKDFLFDPKMARDRVSTLSGGQQNRLMLAKLMTNPANVLILDEPTNDLDMDTLDMLQEMLADYAGTLLIVSHDRDFLDRTVTEVLAFEGDGVIESHLGGYSDYHAAKKLAAAPLAKKMAEAKKEARVVTPPAAPPKLSGKQRFELEKLPEKIAALEAEVVTLRELLLDADLYVRDPALFDATSRRFGEAEAELDAAEMRWLELEERRTNAVFS